MKAREQVAPGVQAFRAGRYPEAERYFSEAVRLNPALTNAKLYLGVIGFELGSSGNNQKLDAAGKQFNEVLKEEPKNPVALEYLGLIPYVKAGSITDPDKKIAKLDQAQRAFQRLAEADPNNKAAFYNEGVIAWAKLHVAMGAAGKPLKDNVVRAQRAKCSDMINQGIGSLKHALELSPDYSDPMAYLGLLYRDRAELAATPEEYRADIAESESWKTKAIETRRRNDAVITP